MSREGKLTPELKSYLFPADRRLLLDGLGKIKKDDIVIFDRYVPSAIAYRMADGIDNDIRNEETMKFINFFIISLIIVGIIGIYCITVKKPIDINILY